MATYTTLATAEAAYLANADYDDGSGDPAKARAFRAACRSLLVLMPVEAAEGSTRTRMSESAVTQALSAVETWLGENDDDQATGGRVMLADFRRVRE